MFWTMDLFFSTKDRNQSRLQGVVFTFCISVTPDSGESKTYVALSVINQDQNSALLNGGSTFSTLMYCFLDYVLEFIVVCPF